MWDADGKKTRFYINGNQIGMTDIPSSVASPLLNGTHIKMAIGNDMDMTGDQCFVDNVNQSVVSSYARLYGWNRSLSHEEVKGVFSSNNVPEGFLFSMKDFTNNVTGPDVVVSTQVIFDLP